MTNPSNPYLQGRGVAGSHDIELGVRTLEQMVSGQGQIKIPFYNKGAYQGKGDRVNEANWPIVEGPVDLIIFEGWMLGYKKLEASPQLDQLNEGMKQVNSLLGDYNRWYEKLDATILVAVEDSSVVY